MLYPLSYRGISLVRLDVSMPMTVLVNLRLRLSQSKQKEIAHEGDLFFGNEIPVYAARVCSVVSANTLRPLSASSMISRTAEVSGFTSIRSQAFK